MAESTSYGGTGFLKDVYYFILITHLILAMALLPLSLFTLTKGLNMQVKKHRKNCTMDNANMALCKYYWRFGIFVDITLLLTTSVLITTHKFIVLVYKRDKRL